MPSNELASNQEPRELEIFKANKEITRNAEGNEIAICNHPDTKLSVEEVKQMRETDINQELFLDHLKMIFERFQKELTIQYFRYAYKTLNAEMGNAEFAAAAKHLSKTSFYLSDLIPKLIEHVQLQREEGPDLLLLHLKELDAAERLHEITSNL